MEAIQIVTPTNKEQLATVKSTIKNAIINGDIDPLKALQQLKLLEKALDVLKDDDVEKVMLKEAEKYHRQELVELNGSKYEIKEVGVKYDYSVCGDSILAELEEQQKQIAEKIKERQEFLKRLPQDVETYNTDGICLCRPAKSATLKVVITL